MKMAKLPDNRIVHANVYDESIHGDELYCIDRQCGTRVFFVPRSIHTSAYFRTTGKNDSKHTPECGFYSPMDPIDVIEKVKGYQEIVLNDSSVQPVYIGLNLNSLDPDYEKKTRNVTESKTEKKTSEEIKITDKKDTPKRISSLKSVVELLTTLEPDVLGTIIFNVSGKKVPLSKMLVNQVDAHNLLWTDQAIDAGYFVHGRIERIIRNEKVTFFVMEEVDGIGFTIVLFAKYYPYFSYPDEALLHKDVIVYGNLRKNEYAGKERTEIIIKTDKYIQVIKRNRNST